MIPLSPLRQHIEKWKDCRACPLCECRNKVVMYRGKVPCGALFVGEGPGFSENSEGVPFWGPAGKLLDRIVVEALHQAGDSVDSGGTEPWGAPIDIWRPLELRIAFTNLVCCIPLGEDGKKTSNPDPAEVLSCKPRLLEFIELCHPKLIVMVGDDAERYLPKWKLSQKLVKIIHPSAILRKPMAQQRASIHKATIILRDAFIKEFKT